MTKQLDPFDTNTDTNSGNPAGLWPYSAGSRLIDRELASNIRAWALARMTEAELHSYSQHQLVSMYFHQHILPTIQSVSPWLNMSETFPELEKLVKLPPEQLLSVMKEQARQRSRERPHSRHRPRA